MSENEIKLDIKSILSRSEDEITEQIISRVAQSYGSTIGYELEQKTKKAVSDFFDEEILPGLKDTMLEMKPEIAKSLRASMLKVAQTLGAKMIERAEKNLDSYTGREVLSKLFSGH